MKEENSSLLVCLESINEEYKELGSLGGKDKFDKVQLNRYIEVPQIKRKQMDTGKKEKETVTSHNAPVTCADKIWPVPVSGILHCHTSTPGTHPVTTSRYSGSWMLSSPDPVTPVTPVTSLTSILDHRTYHIPALFPFIVKFLLLVIL